MHTNFVIVTHSTVSDLTVLQQLSKLGWDIPYGLGVICPSPDRNRP